MYERDKSVKGIQDDYLRKAEHAYSMATNYYDSNFRKQWEDNIRMHDNRHPAGSKYYSEAYTYRSKLFRPKTRSAIRKNEAAATNAFFSTLDAIDIQGANESIEAHRASADLMRELVKYRLEETIPWFQTVIGGIQEAQRMGVVASYNSWKYSQKSVLVPVVDEQTGQQAIDDEGELMFTERAEVLEDKPSIELWPVEQVLFHPGADWVDPINSSPFLIRMIPMYVYEVRERASAEDPKTGQPEWQMPDDKALRGSKVDYFDTLRQERESNREDKYTEEVADIEEYDIVWVHEYFMKDKNGQDEVFYTAGTEFRLSDPKPITDIYLTGDRPVTLGVAILETFKPIPVGVPELGQGLQREANEIANSRLDNVKLVLNKRWFVRRGSQTDIRSIVRNAAGSVTLTSNPKEDIVAQDFNDVTSSSYAEQDRINLDHDELVGNFSQGSVQSNRKLNETVGGMGMLLNSAGQMTDYMLTTFVQTWMLPTIKQLVKLEQVYESDEVILSLAADRSKLAKTYGINQINDQLLMNNLVVNVDIGVGSSNPVFRLERFLVAVTKYAEIAQNAPANMDLKEVASELFGYIGYRNGERFLNFSDEVDPQVQMLMEQIKMLEQAIETKQVENNAKLELEAMKQAGDDRRQREDNKFELVKAIATQQEKEGDAKLQEVAQNVQLLARTILNMQGQSSNIKQNQGNNA